MSGSSAKANPPDGEEPGLSAYSGPSERPLRAGDVADYDSTRTTRVGGCDHPQHDPPADAAYANGVALVPLHFAGRLEHTCPACRHVGVFLQWNVKDPTIDRKIFAQGGAHAIEAVRVAGGKFRLRCVACDLLGDWRYQHASEAEDVARSIKRSGPPFCTTPTGEA